MHRTLVALLLLASSALPLASTSLLAQELHADLVAHGPQEAIVVQRDVAPGETTGPHLHHGTEMGFVTLGEIELHVAGQPTRTIRKEESFSVPRDTPHEARNVSKAPAALIANYIIDKGSALKNPLKDLSPLPATAAAQTGRTPLVTNDQVHVWRSTILPNQPMAMHRHDHARIVIPLGDGLMNFPHPDGTKEVVDWKQGQAYFYPAMAPGELHSDMNVSGKPLEVIVVELENEK